MVQVQDLDGLRAALDGGADVIIVQGNEAGGHTGRRGTLNFVAQALELAADTPVVAAGGIAGGRGLAAALAMGCAGALMGTRFKATDEYVSEAREKDQVVASDGSNTIYDEINDLAYGELWPNKVSGRTLQSAFTDEWLGRDDELREKVAGYPPFGFVQELAEKGTIINWAGEASGLVDRVRPAAEIVQQAAAEAEVLLRRTAELVAEPRRWLNRLRSLRNPCATRVVLDGLRAQRWRRLDTWRSKPTPSRAMEPAPLRPSALGCRCRATRSATGSSASC